MAVHLYLSHAEKRHGMMESFTLVLLQLITADETVRTEFGSVLKSVRIRRDHLRTCWGTVFLFIQELILYSFVKRKEVLIFGYFAKPLGYVCLSVPELLICLKLVCFCFVCFFN